MKKYIKILACLATLCAFNACADPDVKDFQTEKPESLENQEFLNRYAALKSYIDRTANPNFKLGVGTSLDDYVKRGATYLALNDNFDEIVMGWEMKHAAIVQNDGSLNLENVKRLISVAENAGTSIYGHTLCWHSGQNAKYLNSIIAGETLPSEPELVTIEYVDDGDFETGALLGWFTWSGASFRLSAAGEGYESSYAMVLSNDVAGDFWSKSVMYPLTATPKDDAPFKLRFRVKGSAGSSGYIIPSVVEGTWSLGTDFTRVDITTEWQYVELTGQPRSDALTWLGVNIGAFAGDLYIDDISLTQEVLVEGGGNISLGPNLILASDFEDQEIGTWYSWGSTNPTCELSPAGEGYNGGYALKVNNPTAGQFWQGQFGYKIEGTFETGETYQLNMRVKGSQAASLAAVVQLMADPYPSDAFGNVKVTTDWTDVQLTVTVTDNNRDHFLISIGDYEGTLWLDDVSVCKQIVATNEKTPEEKKEIITNALETFIAGMMEECSGYIKAWDVVNEPMSDWPDPSEIKTGIGQTLKEDEFYWQDYMGKDYAVEAFKFARKYGGNNLILFINDYGLEGSADQAKCKGLIEFVKYTEERGALVDGIGTQMHVTCGQTELSNIVLMFQNLAATGKLIKVSELDMGYYSSEEGRNLQTEELTKEQHMEMAQFYEDIIKAYFDNVPASQRYGITQWCPQDSPKDSGWRKGEPTGLWTLEYYRKYTYAGFARGLMISNGINPEI